MSNSTFYGGRLQLARTFHGYTLEEIGKQTGVTRQYVQQVEASENTHPANDLVMAWAEILKTEPDFFFQPLRFEVPEESCHFRKRKTTPLHIKTRAISCGTVFNLLVAYLEAHVGFPLCELPKFAVERKEDIERAAEKCRSLWGLGLDTPISNITRVLETMIGAIVTTFVGVSDKIDAFSYPYFDRAGDIKLYTKEALWRPIVVHNMAKMSSSRARFDLAHELGHIILHADVEAERLGVEDEANSFASAFLLPRAGIIREFPRSKQLSWRGLIDLKVRWGVSLQALVRRAYDLDLITAVQYRSANVYISKKGWRINEPEERSIPFEQPEIIQQALAVLERKGKTVPAIAHDLHMRPEILADFAIA